MQNKGCGNADWQNFYEIVSKIQNPVVVLEFGVGEGSYFIHDRCSELYSLEVIVRDDQYGWADYIRKRTDPRKHTIEEIVLPVDEFTYTLEKKIIEIVERIKPDFVLVDSGCHCRGEIVQLCMHLGIDTILVHDTLYSENLYGWYLLEDYDKKSYKRYRDLNGQGTDLFTKDPFLIEGLNNQS